MKLYKVGNNGFTLRGGGRVYFSTGGELGDPNIYWQTKLLGNKFSYEIDVSNTGCHCNAAGYFSQLPGYNSGQQLEAGPGGDYYCDANFVNNNFCPEYDTFEGNKYTMASALHTCDYVADQQKKKKNFLSKRMHSLHSLSSQLCALHITLTLIQ